MNGLVAAGLTATLAAAAVANGLWPGLKLGVIPLFFLALTTFIATGAGRRAVAAASPGLSEDEEIVAGATLGLGLLSLGLFVFLAGGLLRPWSAPILLGAMWLYGWRHSRSSISILRSMAAGAASRPWLCLSIGGPLLLVLWACLVPPHQYDSLVYHLALPQEYLRAGRLNPPAGTVFAHFPQNGEMLFTLALSLGSDILAQMLVWLGTALTVGWVLTFGRRLTPAAPWAALLIATHTAVLLLSSTAYVEPLVMLWVTASWMSLEVAGSAGNRGPIVLSAAFAGLAMGTKYYAFLPAALLGLRLAWRGRIRDAFIFTAIAAAVLAPWLVKNWIFVGNPVFPFLYRLFPARGVGWTGELAAGYFAILTEYGHSRGWLADFISLPVLLLRNPLRFGGGMDVLGDLGWDLTLWLWVGGLMIGWRRREIRWLAVFSLLYFLGWFSTGVVLRFLTALAPAMALIAAAGVAVWRQTAGVWARRIAAASAAAMIVGHLFLFAFCHGVFGSASALLSLEDRERYLSRRLDYYPCAAATADLPADANVLVVGEQRGYYIARAHLPSTVHGPNLYIRRANEASSSLELARSLRSDGFTHILSVPREAARLGESLGTLTSAGAENWKGLQAHLSTALHGPACELFSLEEPR